MVNIDTVYQRVLAIANKEQRGYITPQEFNLFASQAQMEILEQYFYDLNQFSRIPGNEGSYHDMLDLIDEKLDPFKQVVTLPVNASGIIELENDLYKLGSVFTIGSIEVERITMKQLRLIQTSTLTTPTSSNPVYVGTSNNSIQVSPSSLTISNYEYIRMPIKPNWGYVVMNDRALYDPSSNKTTHFELHRAEEVELVYKILKLAGVAIQKQELAAFANQMDLQKEQKEKQ